MNIVNQFSLRTAILLFSQSDTAESAVKPIANNKKQNDLLWHKMNQKVFKTIHKTQLPFFISNENTQKGDDFGEKLSHAVQAVFCQGFENVIIVGNDTPGLTTKHIQQAAALLEHNKLVIGPDHKGGAYLIGIAYDTYCMTLFSKINWKTSKVVPQLKVFATERYVVLKPLSDFNTFFDLKSVLEDLAFLDLLKSNLLSLLSYHSTLKRFTALINTNTVPHCNFNKGSPVLG